jgi:hypothetical protein
MQARVQQQPREQRPGPATRRRLDRLTVYLDRELPQHEKANH